MDRHKSNIDALYLRDVLLWWTYLLSREEQTTQWPKEKVQKDKQRSTKHTYKTKD
jgi:hypothetical protein